MERNARELIAPSAPPPPLHEPVVMNRPARPMRSRLRVAVLNARGGRRFAAIAACLKRPPLDAADLILLCEADVGMRRSGRRAVAAELAALTGMSYAYVGEWGAAGPDGKIIKQIGNAILSAVPIEAAFAVALPFQLIAPVLWPNRIRRPALGGFAGLVASIRFAGRRLQVGVAHLQSRCDPAGRALQMAAYMAAFPQSGPAIVGGDLNSTTVELSSVGKFARAFAKILADPHRFRWPVPREPLFERLFERGFTLEGANVPGRGTFTFHRLIPPPIRPKLDWIALRGLRAVPGSAAVIAPRLSPLAWRASDHDFVMADVELA